MRRAVLLFAGFVTLGLAGCDSITIENLVERDDPKVVSDEHGAMVSGQRVTKGSIIGRWNVSLVAAAGDPEQLAEDTFSLREELKSATKEVAGEENVDDPDLFNWLRIEAEFRPDGTCSLTADNLHEDGTWELNGEELTETFEGKPGKTETLAWDGPDKFTLMRTDGIMLSFVREK